MTKEKIMKMVPKATCVLLFAACVPSAVLSAEAARPVFKVSLHSGRTNDWKRIMAEIANARQRGLPPGPIEVVVPTGEHRLTETWEIGLKDGGSETNPLIIRADGPGAVVHGGKRLERTLFFPLTDSAEAARFPASARNKILCCDISRFVKGEPEPWPDNNFKGSPTGPWLYLGKRMLPLARWPNEGESSEKGWASTPLRESRNDRLEFDNPRMEGWDFKSGVWALGWWEVDWLDGYIRFSERRAIKDAQTAKVLMLAQKTPIIRAGPGASNGIKARRFFFLNIPMELDAPGEWWIDRAKKKLYWYPVKGDDAPEIAVLDCPLLRLTDARYVTVEGVSFGYSHTDKASVSLEAAENCTFRRCEFTACRENALEIGPRSRVCRIESCEFVGIGGSAVKIDGGDRKRLVYGRNIVKDCRISAYGLLKRTYRPGVEIKGCGNALVGCDISDSPFIAIWYNGNDNLVADNMLHDVCLYSRDSSAIYTGADTASCGNVIFCNDIRHVGAEPVAEKAMWHRCFYLDNCDWGDWLVGNRMEDAGPALWVSGNNLMRIANNLAVNCSYGMGFSSPGINWPLYRGSYLNDRKTGYSWYRQLLSGYDYREAPWCAAYPRLDEVVDNEPRFPMYNQITNNFFIGCKRQYFTEWLDSKAAFLTNAIFRANVVRPDMVSADIIPLRPVRLSDAVVTRVTSPKGSAVAEFFLDEAGRFSWTLDAGGARILDVSPLGLTVDDEDLGRPIVPGKAVVGADGATAIPLRSILTGATVAFLEVRFESEKCVQWRWRVPGEGRRRVRGAFSAWVSDCPARYDVTTSGECPDWPEMFVWDRAPRMRGVSYPMRPRGWTVEGEIVSPWCVTRVIPPRYLLAEPNRVNSIRVYCDGKIGTVTERMRSTKFGPDGKPIYLNRLDAVVLQKNGRFHVILGEPSEGEPKAPPIPEGDVLCGHISVDKTVWYKIEQKLMRQVGAEE